MKSENYYYENFSHIYVEKCVESHPVSKEIIRKFANSKIIPISDYKEVFNTSFCDFSVEKSSIKLILAEKKDKFIYKGSRFCDNYNFTDYYYTNIVLNCLYNCQYCFLRGMHDSPHIVLFVNFHQLEEEVKFLEKNSYISLSYETDVLAFKNFLYGDMQKFHLDLIRNNPDKVFEIRTKSKNIEHILEEEKLDNLILSFTLSPNEIIEKYEKNTVSLKDRINCIQLLQKKGYKVRICFDPLLDVAHYEEIYRNFFTTIREKIDCEKIFDFSVGTFRIGRNYLKRLKRNSPKNEISHYPYLLRENYYGYSQKKEDELIEWMLLFFKKENEEGKVFIWR